MKNCRRRRMITPIRTMTINQLIARQDDLLVSVDDIKKLAENERANERAKTIDEIGMKLCAEIYFGYELEERVWEVLEQMKEQK